MPLFFSAFSTRPSAQVRVVLAVATALCARVALAGEAAPSPLATAPTNTASPAEILLPASLPSISPLVSLDLHGHFRSRTEMLSGIRLVKDVQQLPPRLDLRHGSDSVLPGASGGKMATADLRLRIDPTLHIGEWFDINSQIDLAGATVLGGDNNPTIADREARAVENLSGMPSQGDVRNAAAVRRLWVHARLFGLAELEIGRTGDHFGLGMLRNAGGDLLGDFQSDVDRVSLRGDLFGLRLMLARDSLGTLPFASTLPNAFDHKAESRIVQTGTGSIAYGLEDAADVTRWVAEITGGKLNGEPGLKWSAAAQYQTQDVASRADHEDCIANASCDQLVPRNGRLIIAQLALDWNGTLGGSPLRLQGESAGIYGSFGRTDPRSGTESPLLLLSAGAAFKAKWQRGLGDVLVDAGFASGDRSGGFGVLDTDNLRNGAELSASPKTFSSGFHFHRNYRVDGLLFRDLIGAVANAWYLKPAYRYELLDKGHGDSLALELGLLAAVAASSEATPGKGNLLGFEPELSLEYRQPSGTGALLRATYLFPGGALATPQGLAADNAWRVEGAVRFGF